MKRHERVVIAGMEDGRRVETRVLEERIQSAAAEGYRNIEVHAYGQHGIGGRLWKSCSEGVFIDVHGYPGQRIGSMGSPCTHIDVHGPAPDDVGWLNAGATIVIRGDATNGVANAMAQGKIYVAGDIGARGMTMTKSNPRFSPPELWVLGGVGDSFAEFMAGGVAVVCGLGSHYRGNILGHRPCVGMVGGKIFFRGVQKNFSEADAKLVKISEDDWQWLTTNMKDFLKAIDREDLYDVLTRDRSRWQMLTALSPHEKALGQRMSMSRFRSEVWERELGAGGLIGDLADLDRSQIPIIATGPLRRFVPVWENHKYLPPCQAGCPTGMPVQKRWELIRRGEVQEAIDLALLYTPFPATVCGYLCPNLCMESCTRTRSFLPPVDVSALGRAGANAAEPMPAEPTGKKIAIIGGGPAGLSVAWQLRIMGHEPVVYDRAERPGGKIAAAIPESRFPKEIFEKELERVLGMISYRRMTEELDQQRFLEIRDSHDFTVVATGAWVPRTLNIKGVKRAVPALDFLRGSKCGAMAVGERVVIIGAGNVGCDAATEAHRQGAKDITLIDIQEPASFGKERAAAEKAGARFLWPVSVSAITTEGVELADGKILPCDTVVVAIGDRPDISFLPTGIDIRGGFIVVDDAYRTSDPQVYAIGDSVKPGLLTDAIGAGRMVSRDIDARLKGLDEPFDRLPPMNTESVKLQYYDPGRRPGEDIVECSTLCASCGGCRDCGLCETVCPRQAVSRRDLQRGGYEYRVDGDLCIGCGFCAGACPCGIWEMKENEPLD
ncbi:MAG TPA: FAD-dependent oxidoreductase [Deltaproteobacteria bacterium]|nr:FAD-dependent oxidoreductase [Deltaproteobacteria bacterium]